MRRNTGVFRQVQRPFGAIVDGKEPEEIKNGYFAEISSGTLKGVLQLARIDERDFRDSAK